MLLILNPVLCRLCLSIFVTNLASLNTIDINTGNWDPDSGRGANAYFYARIGSVSYELIATHTKLN